MLRISRTAWQKIMDAVTFNPNLEVGGFGRLTVQQGKTPSDVVLFCDDIMIPPQTVTVVHTQIDAAALDWLQIQRLGAGDIGSWWLWWHSHAGMPTSPSGTDTTTLARAASDVWGGKALGLVVNVNEDRHAWLDYTNPVLGRLDSVKVGTQVEQYYDEAIRNEVWQTMMDNVTIEPPKPVSTANENRKAGTPRRFNSGSLDFPDLEEYLAVAKVAEEFGIGDLTDAEWAILQAGDMKFGEEASKVAVL